MTPRSTSLRRAAGYGVLWGLTVTASEALVLPFGRLQTRGEWVLMTSVLFDWIVVGCLLAAATLWLEPLLIRSWRLLLTLLVLPLLGAALIQLAWAIRGGMGVNSAIAPLIDEPFPSLSNYAYLTWMILFHGSLFVLALIWIQRGQRHRDLLGRAQIARQGSEALLDRAQLEALRQQVDPAFVLRAMTAIQARYAVDTVAGDELLDRLVAFLRQTMPGLRTGRSTLQAEIELARCYAQLRLSITPASTAWRIEARRPTAAADDLPFPPFVLLPLLDRLAPVTAGTDVQPGGRVSLHVDGGQARLLIEAHADADRASLPQALIYHLQVALYALYGDTCHITTRPDARHGGADRALQIEWTLSPQHKVASLLEADSISTQTTGV
jgi:hypothetical protein